MTSLSKVVVALPEHIAFREGFTQSREWLDMPDEAMIGKLVRSPAKTTVAAIKR